LHLAPMGWDDDAFLTPEHLHPAHPRH
jgi:hypothetical protein